jgi:hypothetical protein
MCQPRGGHVRLGTLAHQGCDVASNHLGAVLLRYADRSGADAAADVQDPLARSDGGQMQQPVGGDAAPGWMTRLPSTARNA